MSTSGAAQPTVQVIATTADGTSAALAAAVPLASGSFSRLVLFVPRIVPFPVDLEHPADRLELFVERYRRLIAKLGANADIQVCVCRRIDDLLARVVDTDPVVVGGTAGRWRMSAEERFAKRLARRVTRVIFVASREATPNLGHPVTDRFV